MNAMADTRARDGCPMLEIEGPGATLARLGVFYAHGREGSA